MRGDVLPAGGGHGGGGCRLAQTWKDTGRSLLTEGRGGQQADVLHDMLGIDDGESDQAVDDTFGPSPEERAARQGRPGQQGQ